jgi:hypothetical protein
MAADENKKDSQTESGAASGSGQGTNQPSTPYAEEDTKRIGTREDIRSTGSESGSKKSEQPDNLRNGT